MGKSLTGYMQMKDPGRISSIVNVDDKERRKKIIPIGETSPNSTLNSLYVWDCASHEPRGVLASVELMKYEKGQFTSLGIAKCCPLCWLVIIPPPDSKLPPPQPLKEKQPLTSKQREALRTGRRKSRGRLGGKSPTGEMFQKILDWWKVGEEHSVYDIMEFTGLARQASLRYLRYLTNNKKIEKLTTGAGRGSRSSYRKLP